MPAVDSQSLVVSNSTLVPAQADRGVFGMMTPNFGVGPANRGYVAPAGASSAYVGSNSSAFTSAISNDPTKRATAATLVQQQSMQVTSQTAAQCLLGAVLLVAILTH